MVDYLAVLDETFGHKQIIMTGRPVYDREGLLPESIQTFKTPEDLDNLL